MQNYSGVVATNQAAKWWLSCLEGNSLAIHILAVFDPSSLKYCEKSGQDVCPSDTLRERTTTKNLRSRVFTLMIGKNTKQ
ncbi:MAG: hypothetical protein ACFCUV_10840 [Rivularia sp. (in: cyanobacteria)]